MIKNLPAMQETQVSSLGWEDLPGRKWQPTLVPFPGESHGQRSLSEYSPWGCKESTPLSNQLFHLHFQQQHVSPVGGNGIRKKANLCPSSFFQGPVCSVIRSEEELRRTCLILPQTRNTPHKPPCSCLRQLFWVLPSIAWTAAVVSCLSPCFQNVLPLTHYSPAITVLCLKCKGNLPKSFRVLPFHGPQAARAVRHMGHASLNRAASSFPGFPGALSFGGGEWEGVPPPKKGGERRERKEGLRRRRRRIMK